LSGGGSNIRGPLDKKHCLFYKYGMDAGEKLILHHILEQAGYVVCEAKDDIDPQVITLKLWHKPIPSINVMEIAMIINAMKESERRDYGKERQY
jgi:hypothetical protein